MDTSLVTFVVPARNAERTISACVKSILRQGTHLAELIIIDDASTDNTIQVATEAADNDSRLRILQLTTHSGIAAALNAGLKATKTPYFARLDADDICLADDRLSRQLAFLQAHPQIQVLGTGTLASRHLDDTTKTYALRPCQPLLVAWGLHFSCCIAHPSVLCRTQALQNVGGYPESNYAEDYELWLKLTDMQPLAIANISEPLVWLRKSSSSVSASNRDIQRQNADTAAVAAFGRRLKREIEKDVAIALRRPEACASVTTLKSAAQLLLQLEHHFLAKNAQSDEEEYTRARHLIKADVNARLAAITLAAARNSSSSSNEDVSQVVTDCATFLTDRDPGAMSTFLGAICYSTNHSSRTSGQARCTT
eukprot:CAMPEP_0197323036 /NCGR_PEP_ID=MMETSP0891-20130614/70270_1 /TAXON_ID=44058 ORGANISM="Aureoumbra lagunensis, Strain CCMP1510" /NCGR_SAMPLE_ID=MMETSP0891 /ASSEMBLY_ACC=CAM_ASM_000534 /LENGTH=366 /DNA_ID=CAMNT_0042815583 /DNA_START=979 /DNA_END=2079 /DNA_ORIENTATION=-